MYCIYSGDELQEVDAATLNDPEKVYYCVGCQAYIVRTVTKVVGFHKRESRDEDGSRKAGHVKTPSKPKKAYAASKTYRGY